MSIGLKKIIRMFDCGNCCVFGLRGRGKDMLFANVILRRTDRRTKEVLPYVSNVDYGGSYIPFVPDKFDCGKNTYENFISNDLLFYRYPYPDGCDLYISDAGVYFPSQYCKELNKRYGYFCTYFALSRHLGQANCHVNVQSLGRCWDKIREQSDTYISCRSCRVLFGKLVVQKVWVYEKYESALNNVPPYRRPFSGGGSQTRAQVAIEKQKYFINYGRIKPMTLIYVNKSRYDTRAFRYKLEAGRIPDDK